MKTYNIINSDGIPKRLNVERCSYRGHTACKAPLAIRVWEEGQDVPHDIPFGILTANVGPYVGIYWHDETHAFVMTDGENASWAPQLLEAMVTDGTAKDTGVFLNNSSGSRQFKFYEFNI